MAPRRATEHRGPLHELHVEGGIAPFALTSYANAKTYGAALTADVKAGTMPPWKAGAADVGSLRNPALTDAQ